MAPAARLARYVDSVNASLPSPFRVRRTWDSPRVRSACISGAMRSRTGSAVVARRVLHDRVLHRGLQQVSDEASRIDYSKLAHVSQLLYELEKCWPTGTRGRGRVASAARHSHLSDRRRLYRAGHDRPPTKDEFVRERPARVRVRGANSGCIPPWDYPTPAVSTRQARVATRAVSPSAERSSHRSVTVCTCMEGELIIYKRRVRGPAFIVGASMIVANVRGQLRRDDAQLALRLIARGSSSEYECAEATLRDRGLASARRSAAPAETLVEASQGACASYGLFSYVVVAACIDGCGGATEGCCRLCRGILLHFGLGGTGAFAWRARTTSATRRSPSCLVRADGPDPRRTFLGARASRELRTVGERAFPRVHREPALAPRHARHRLLRSEMGGRGFMLAAEASTGWPAWRAVTL